MALKCLMCGMLFPPHLLNRHIGIVHENEPNFRINCDFPGCGTSYSKWRSYVQPVQHNGHKHRRNFNEDNVLMEENVLEFAIDEEPLDEDNILMEENVLEFVIDEEPLVQEPIEPMTPTQKLAFQSALFVANLPEKLMIPQSTVQSIIESTCLLIEDYLAIIQDSLLSTDEPVDSQVIRNVFKDCKPSEMFQHCKNPYQLHSFMLKSLNMIAPEKVIIGKKRIWSKNGELKEQKAVAYVVPFLKSLKLCLNNRDILQCVDNPRPKERSFQDGYRWSLLS
ncbi:uncharacterized protein [Temnothorax longispinosus]|uniref:uncharacterized protein n=1 Tax=Temnothorax longispinosus TaxID=300112 RepID=UPI003A997958